MNWKSQEEIQRRAEISDEEALNVSIEEWIDKCEAIKRGECARTGGCYCGVCVRAGNLTGNSDCTKCCLETPNANCCLEYENFLNDQTLSNAQAMLNRLYLERGKRYRPVPDFLSKKVCKKEEPPAIRHGDYRVSVTGWIQFYIKDSAGAMRLCENDHLYDNPMDCWSIVKDKDSVISGNLIDDLLRRQAKKKDC